jgi:hypothetical protein
MAKKLTQEYVEQAFSERYWSLQDKYINSKTKLKCCCSNGHIVFIRWNDFSQGHGCIYCSNLVKPNYTLIREAFELEGYTLLSKEQLNSRTKLEYLCDNGHTSSILWSDFRNGHRCQRCASSKEKNKSWKGGVIDKQVTLHETYTARLSKYHNISKLETEGLELLGVECTHCKKIFNPSPVAIMHRVNAINNSLGADNNFYCSEECKHACPIYRQVLWPKDHKPYKEDDRPEQKAWAILVKKRDNYTCQKCGNKEDIMYAHHIDPIINNPIESMDLDNGITLCKFCHKEVHKISGCKYSELRCSYEEMK